MASIKLPVWLRVAVVVGLVVLTGSAGVLVYRWYTHPVTLSIAVGSLDGEAQKIVSAIASQLAATDAPVRLNVVQTDSAIESARAFSSGKTDLAVVRGDVGDLSHAQAVAILAEAAVLVVAPPGSSTKDMADLKRVTVGVVGGEVNQKLVGVLTRAYDLQRASVVFKNFAPREIRRALDAREVRAVLFVAPLTEKYLSLVRGLFPQHGKSAPTLISIDLAGAIAENERAYESFDLPKGTLRGAPPIPEEDLTTLRVPLYVVASSKLDNDVVAAFTKAFMDARRDLLSEQPILKEVKMPDTEPGAWLPVHPGAAEFYNGTGLSFLDKWSNAIFLAPMAVGALLSIIAAAWKFLRVGELDPREEALDSLYALGRRIRSAEKISDLLEIENQIDEVLRTQRSKVVTTEEERDLDAATLNVAAHRLEDLIHDRRAVLTAPK